MPERLNTYKLAAAGDGDGTTTDDVSPQVLLYRKLYRFIRDAEDASGRFWDREGSKARHGQDYAAMNERFRRHSEEVFGVESRVVTEVPEEVRPLLTENPRSHFYVPSYDSQTWEFNPHQTVQRLDITLPDGRQRMAVVMPIYDGMLYGHIFELQGPVVEAIGGNHDFNIGEFTSSIAT